MPIDYIVVQSSHPNIYQSAYINFAQIWYLGIVPSDTNITSHPNIYQSDYINFAQIWYLGIIPPDTNITKN